MTCNYQIFITTAKYYDSLRFKKSDILFILDDGRVCLGEKVREDLVSYPTKNDLPVVLNEKMFNQYHITRDTRQVFYLDKNGIYHETQYLELY